MAAPRQGLPVRLDRAPQRGAAFAITRASRRARTRSIGSRSRAGGSSLIFDHPPPSLPLAPRYRVARDHGLPFVLLCFVLLCFVVRISNAAKVDSPSKSMAHSANHLG